MNPRQAAFYRQAAADWAVFSALRAGRRPRWRPLRKALGAAVGLPPFDFPVCHELHYLQMCTEKLAKAYYRTDLRTGHAAFRRFANDLGTNPAALSPLGFRSPADLSRWLGSVRHVIGAVEDLAPAIADRANRPNPEYPWPRNSPAVAPADYPFRAEVFDHLDAQARTGEPPFLIVLGRMVGTMAVAGWHM